MRNFFKSFNVKDKSLTFILLLVIVGNVLMSCQKEDDETSVMTILSHPRLIATERFYVEGFTDTTITKYSYNTGANLIRTSKLIPRSIHSFVDTFIYDNQNHLRYQLRRPYFGNNYDTLQRFTFNDSNQIVRIEGRYSNGYRVSDEFSYNKGKLVEYHYYTTRKYTSKIKMVNGNILYKSLIKIDDQNRKPTELDSTVYGYDDFESPWKGIPSQILTTTNFLGINSNNTLVTRNWKHGRNVAIVRNVYEYNDLGLPSKIIPNPSALKQVYEYTYGQ